MYSEINVKVEDGNLGRSGATGRNAQIKIGVSTAAAGVPVIIKSTMTPAEIKEKLGQSPLADACIDATENGLKTIYAFPVAATTQGTVSTVDKTGEDLGSFAVTGNPTNAFDVTVKITETGDTNEGSFQYSIDGGNSFSDDLTIPLGGSFVLTGTGLTLTFTDITSEAKSFNEGSVYAFSTTAPAMSNAAVLAVLEDIEQNFTYTAEVCHIVGTSTTALWAAVQTMAGEFLTVYKKPMIFLFEARPCGANETADAYLAAMKAERRGISSYFICICLTWMNYQRKDLRIQNINAAGLISGLIGRAKESLSIGYVREFPISSAKCLKLLPEGIEALSEEFDALGYTVLRTYTGKEDFYVSNANVMAPGGSDFRYVESVRVLDRIVREIAVQATDEIQCEVDPENIEVSLAGIEAHLNIPIELCVRDKVISSGTVEIEREGLNILRDETLNVRAEWVPMGTARVFNLTFAVNNPATGNEG